MNVRRVLVAASAVGALVASTPATAVGTYTLDGYRTTSRTWSGVLSTSSLPVAGATRLATDPVLEDCTEQSCSVRNLRLTLPKGRTKGEFVVSGVFDASMAAALVLYNAKGEYVRSADLIGCCGQFDGDQGTYGLNFKIKMLNAGRYTFAVVNRGGTGSFKATITWTTLPPERKKPTAS